MEKKNEIIDVKTDEIKSPPAVIEQGDSMLSEAFVERAGKQIELRQKLLMSGLRALKQHDFQDFDGKPYLEGEGAARIMSVVRGFKVGEPKFTVENISPHYFVECEIPMEFMGATTVAYGDCSTADKFFEWRVKKYTEQTASEVMATRLMLGDAKKKARENSISRGVSELLGIKGLTWEDLGQLGFIRAQAGSSISFKKGSAGGEVKTLSVGEALKSTKGSVINVKGQVIDVKTRNIKIKGKDSVICDYYLSDGTNKVRICKFGECVDGLKANDNVFAEKVAVSEYQGSLQYLADSIEIQINVEA